MRLDELNLPNDHESLTRILHDRGWEEVGAGYYATVYSKPGINYVLKIFEQDSAYLAFLDMIAKNPNPHFPRIIGKIRVGDQWGKKTYRAVRMEKLLPLNGVRVNEHVFTGISAKNGVRLNSVQEHSLELANEYLEDKPTLVVALDLIVDKLLNRFTLDLGNDVMQRQDGTPVITDPIDR